MRFLADQGISSLVVAALAHTGHDAVHVRDLGMKRASDAEILDRAEAEDRIVIAEDLGFSALVVPIGRTKPSVILFRDATGKTAVRIRLLLENPPALESVLANGAIVVLDDCAARVRKLVDPGDLV
jgi:predicted nuclease of predicted toxin-antitoxin system